MLLLKKILIFIDESTDTVIYKMNFFQFFNLFECEDDIHRYLDHNGYDSSEVVIDYMKDSFEIDEIMDVLS